MVNRRVVEKYGWQHTAGRRVTGKELIAAAHAMEQMKSQAQFMKKLVGMLVITMCLLVACALYVASNAPGLPPPEDKLRSLNGDLWQSLCLECSAQVSKVLSHATMPRVESTRE